MYINLQSVVFLFVYRLYILNYKLLQMPSMSQTNTTLCTYSVVRPFLPFSGATPDFNRLSYVCFTNSIEPLMLYSIVSSLEPCFLFSALSLHFLGCRTLVRHPHIVLTLHSTPNRLGVSQVVVQQRLEFLDAKLQTAMSKRTPMIMFCKIVNEFFILVRKLFTLFCK